MSAIKEIGAGWAPTRLKDIRRQLEKHGFHGYVIPRWDQHQFEYTPVRHERLAWSTGFTGSWGVAIITLEQAALFIDGRYTAQAANEVCSLHFDQEHLFDAPPQNWLRENFKADQLFGYDPAIATPELIDDLTGALQRCDSKIAPLWENPVDAAWTDRPEERLAPAEQFPLSLAGDSSACKREKLARLLQKNDLDFLVATQPDNVNWLFNLRGADLEYCPVVLARALIHKSGQADLFIDGRQLDFNIDYEFQSSDRNVIRHEPDAFFDILSERLKDGARIGADYRFSPIGVRDIARKAKAEAVYLPDPVTALKAIKNNEELTSQRQVALRDSALWCQFARWLEETVPQRDAAGEPVTELEAETYIDRLRKNEHDFYGSSFRTISATDHNAVLSHYAAPLDGGAPITRQSIYLQDSGAQYRDGGTTDTTRVFCFDTPDDDIKTRYTLVLKGHIALATQLFPDGTTGHQLDAFARAPLWSFGLDYDHGTGHGVGPYLSVHEFPQRLQKAPSLAAIEPGMTLTVEPGYYEPGRYGIRIEILYEIIRTEKPGFISMRPLAFVPIQTSMIDMALMTQPEVDWLDAYHAQTREKISPLIRDDKTLKWLDAATAPLTR